MAHAVAQTPVETVTDEALLAKRRRSVRRQGMIVRVATVLVGVAGVGLWQYVGGKHVDLFWISEPSAILDRLESTVRSGQLLRDTRATMAEFFWGYVIGSVAGIVTGFALARAELLGRVLNPYIAGFYGIPKLALAPLFILWLGIGQTSRVVFVLLNVYFLVFYNTYSGFRNVPPSLTIVSRVLGANELATTWKVRFPHASPWILTGLRISIPFGISAAVVSEFIAASEGLGYRIYFNSNSLDTTGALTGIAVLAVIVMVLSTCFDYLENKVILRWRPTATSDSASLGAAY
jgi:NitT/TauT family transport system permease protein